MYLFLYTEILISVSMQAASALMLSQSVVRGFPVTVDVQDLIASLLIVFSDLNQVGVSQCNLVFRISD